jgi:PAS domain S-box-containing protein
MDEMDTPVRARDAGEPTTLSDLHVRVLDSMTEGVSISDEHGIILYTNPAEDRIFGYGPGELTGKHASVQTAYSKAESDRRVAAVIAQLNSRGAWTGERFNRRSDGTVFYTFARITALEIQGRRYFVCVQEDITTSKEAEQEHRALERELLLLIEASSALLARPHTSDVLRVIIELAQRFVLADGYAVWRLGENDYWTLVSAAGLSARFVEASRISAAEQPGLPRGPRLLEDIDVADLPEARRVVLREEGIRSVLEVPLPVHDERAGTVVFYWRSPHRITPREVRIAVALGNLAAAALRIAEVHEQQLENRMLAEAAERRAAFLAEAGAVLSSSLDSDKTLQAVARLAVPSFADWCAVDVLTEAGDLQRVAVHHIDPQRVHLAYQLRERYPPLDDDPSRAVVRTGRSMLIEDLPEGLVSQLARDAEHARLILELGLKSFIVAPMTIAERTYGTITFATAESGRRYTSSDLQLAEEIARRAATSLDHARLYHEVRDNEQLTTTIIENASAALFMLGTKGQCTYMNEAGERMTGYRPDELLGKVFHEVVHHTRHDGTRYPIEECPINAALPDQKVLSGFEDFFIHKDGSFFPVRCFASPIFNAEVPSGTLLEVRDISAERKAAEEREVLLRGEQQARRTAELLNRVGPLLAAELDPERLSQKITDIATQVANAEFGALFHNVRDDRGESYMLYTLSGVPREAFESFPMPRNTQVFGPTFRGEGTVRSDDITEDPRYGRNPPYNGMPEGHLPVRSYLAAPIISRFGEVLGGLFFGHSQRAVFTDETERLVTGIAAQAAVALDNARLFTDSQHAREALQQSVEELRRVNQDLNQFAYSASHDLQEPLRMVSIYSQMLKRKFAGKLGGDGDEYIRYTVQGAARMKQLVRDLLAYTQASNTQEPIKLINSGEALDRALAKLRGPIEDSGAAITRTFLPQVSMRQLHLEQLWENLIGNAIKFRRDEPLRIDVSAEQRERECVFSVSDNGIGIDEQYKEHIFGIFKRLHTADQYSGTGIGLAICHRIVQRAGGRIWVESELGRGSTFHFIIPSA